MKTTFNFTGDFATSSYCLLESSKEYTNILIASRQFLVEEIEPLLLVESFPANFTAIVNINFRDIKDRRKRTETFLQIIEAEQSFDILVDVIEKRKMHYVSRMINLWERSRAIGIFLHHLYVIVSFVFYSYLINNFIYCIDDSIRFSYLIYNRFYK